MKTVGIIAGGIVLNFALMVLCGSLLAKFFYLPHMRHNIPPAMAIGMLSEAQWLLLKSSTGLVIAGGVGLFVGWFQKSRAGIVSSVCLVPALLFELHSIGFNWSCKCVLAALMRPSFEQGFQFLVAIATAAATILSQWRAKRAVALAAPLIHAEPSPEL